MEHAGYDRRQANTDDSKRQDAGIDPLPQEAVETMHLRQTADEMPSLWDLSAYNNRLIDLMP